MVTLTEEVLTLLVGLETYPAPAKLTDADTDLSYFQEIESEVSEALCSTQKEKSQVIDK